MTAVRVKELQHLLIGAGIALAVLAPLSAVAFVRSGIYDVGASARHSQFTTSITHATMIYSVRHHAAGISPPGSTSATQLLDGYCSYQRNCAACHGAASVARQQWVNGMEPQPPYLLDVPQRFTPAQLFGIAKNGIKMTGMPGWGGSMSDRQIWDVVAWLEAGRQLPPQTYAQWQTQQRCSAYGSAASVVPDPSPSSKL